MDAKKTSRKKSRKTKQSLSENWLTGTPKDWDAREVVNTARHVLRRFNETQIQKFVPKIEVFLDEMSEYLNGSTDGEIIDRIGYANLALGSALEEKTLDEILETFTPTQLGEFEQSIEKAYSPLVDRFRSNPDDLHNQWHLALWLYGGIPPKSLLDVALDELYAILALYAVARHYVLSAYKFALDERSNLAMHASELERFAQTGRKIHAKMKEGRLLSAAIRTERSLENRRQWIELALEEWPSHPGYTVDDMAQMIKEKTGTDAKVGTIRKAIKGKKTSLFKTRQEEIKDEQRKP